jgi:hypothetical protein
MGIKTVGFRFFWGNLPEIIEKVLLLIKMNKTQMNFNSLLKGYSSMLEEWTKTHGKTYGFLFLKMNLSNTKLS